MKLLLVAIWQWLIKNKGNLMIDLYKWLWSRVGGRPWTYILRDTYHKFEVLWLIGLVAVGAVLGHWFWSYIFWILLTFAVGYIGGHLFWGKDWIPGQRADDTEQKK